MTRGGSGAVGGPLAGVRCVGVARRQRHSTRRILAHPCISFSPAFERDRARIRSAMEKVGVVRHRGARPARRTRRTALTRRRACGPRGPRASGLSDPALPRAAIAASTAIFCAADRFLQSDFSPPEEQEKLLEEATNVAKAQAFQMKRCLVRRALGRDRELRKTRFSTPERAREKKWDTVCAIARGGE